MRTPLFFFFSGIIPRFVLDGVLVALGAPGDSGEGHVAAVIGTLISEFHELSQEKCDLFLTIFGLLDLITQHKESLLLDSNGKQKHDLPWHFS